jgi:hypothetical protein
LFVGFFVPQTQKKHTTHFPLFSTRNLAKVSLRMAC